MMDNRSSLIPICLILTSGASLRASLPLLQEKPSSLILCLLLDTPSATSLVFSPVLNVIDAVIVPVASTNVVPTSCLALRTRYHYLLVVYIVTVLPHRRLTRRCSLFASTSTVPWIFISSRSGLTLFLLLALFLSTFFSLPRPK